MLIVSFVFILSFIILNFGGLLIIIITRKRADFKNYYDSDDINLKSKNIKVTTDDGIILDTYEVEHNKPKGFVIILSGIYSPSVTAFFGYANYFKSLGFSSVLIEMRGHGKSSGNKISLGYTEWNDVNAVVDLIDSKHRNIPIILFGTSMGGAVSIISAGKNNRINGVIAQSSYSSIEENIMDLLQINNIPPIITKAQKPFTKFWLGLKYGFKNIAVTPKELISRIDLNSILLVHSKLDSQVGYNNFLRLVKSCKSSPKTLIVEGDNHFILNDQEFDNPLLNKSYSKVLSDFLLKFI